MSLLHSLLHSGHLRAIDHALALTLQRLRPDTPEPVALAAALASRALSQGHSYLPLIGVPELLAEINPEQAPPTLPALAAWLAALRASPWVCAGQADEAAVLVLAGEGVALRRYWQYERRLAAAILARCAAPLAALEPAADPALEQRLRQLFPDPDDQPQAAAAIAVLSRRFLLLTGGPGTGKTTTVARSLVLFAEQFRHRPAAAAAVASVSSGTDEVAAASAAEGPAPRILLAAPTGKAAARLAEAVRENIAGLVRDGLLATDVARCLPGEARTLHRLLGWQRGGVEFRHGRDNPLPADLVVVDEASMIDLPLMCKLFEAIAPGTTLVLIGDRDQLPSVETGDVLATLCDAASGKAGANSDNGISSGAAVATASVPAGNVATGLAPAWSGPSAIARVHLTHAHRQAGDVDVAQLAALIRDGDAEAALAGLDAELFRGVHWRHGPDRALLEAVLAQALPAYRAVQAAVDVGEALARARQFRVLCAVREGPAGSQTLNAQLAGALDPGYHGGGFFRGQLLLVTQNSYRHGLFNGDIGIAWPDPQGELRVWFDAEGGPRAWLPAALPTHESAFALTVHKAQGSEFGRVFLALPEHGARPVSRELLYTGLTRCRSQVTLWASASVLRAGIARRAQRWSGLAEKLRRSS